MSDSPCPIQSITCRHILEARARGSICRDRSSQQFRSRLSPDAVGPQVGGRSARPHTARRRVCRCRAIRRTMPTTGRVDREHRQSLASLDMPRSEGDDPAIERRASGSRDSGCLDDAVAEPIQGGAQPLQEARRRSALPKPHADPLKKVLAQPDRRLTGLTEKPKSGVEAVKDQFAASNANLTLWRLPCRSSSTIPTLSNSSPQRDRICSQHCSVRRRLRHRRRTPMGSSLRRSWT